MNEQEEYMLGERAAEQADEDAEALDDYQRRLAELGSQGGGE